MTANDSFEFTTKFEDQTVAKSFIEQTNEKSSKAADHYFNKTDSVNPPTRTDTTSNFAQCYCEHPIISTPSQHQRCGDLQGPLRMTSSGSHYSISPTLCCACKMVRSLPTCKCISSTQKTNEQPTSSSISENHDAEKNTPEITARRNSCDAEKDAVERQREEARRKRNEARYELLKPTYHKLDLRTTSAIDKKKQPISPLPWCTKRLVSPIRPFPRRHSSRISRRLLFRSRHEKDFIYETPAPVLDTRPLLQALVEMNASIITSKSESCCSCRGFNSCAPGATQQMNMMSPMMSPMFSPMMNPAAMMRNWNLGNSPMSSVHENCEIESAERLSRDRMQSASPNIPQIIEEKTAGSLLHTPPPRISIPPPTQPRSAQLMKVPDIVVLEPTPVPETDRKDSDSSTLGQITDLVHDHVVLSHADPSEMISKPDSDSNGNRTNVSVNMRIKETITSYHESVLLKDPKNHPSKIIHVPSSRDPTKIRGFLVPKDFEPVKNIKRRELPPESVPLKCQHDVPVDKRKGSCSLHGTHDIGFVCTCVED